MVDFKCTGGEIMKSQKAQMSKDMSKGPRLIGNLSIIKNDYDGV